MKQKSVVDVVSRLKKYSRISGVLTFVIGSAALFGWIFDIPLLKSLHPSLVSMKANTAIAILLAGASLSFINSRQRSSFNALVVPFCAAVVAAIGLITFFEYIGGWDLDIDQFFVQEPIGTVGTYIPGRMALNTAFCFACLGIGILLARSKSDIIISLSQLCSLMAAFIALTALIGYFYNINEFYGYTNFTKMALHTAFVLLILSTGALCAVPERGIMTIISADDFGGFLARRLLPAAITIPILVGWLRLEGERHQFFGTAFGALIAAVVYIVLFMLLVWKVARSLNRIDYQRKQVEEAIRMDESRLESLLKISQHQTESKQELLDFALNEAIALTGSKIGYIYFYDDIKQEFTLNTWSKDVMKECTIVEPQTLYQLEKTGLWGEAVRQKKPIIENDFHMPNPLKKGYPEGHAPLLKYLTIPVISDDRIVAVVGVANKTGDYDDADVRQLTLLMDNVWQVAERKRAENELRKLSRAVEQSPASIVITNTKGAIEYVNPKFVEITGYSFQEAVGKNPRILKSGEKSSEEYKQLWDVITAGSEWRGEFHNKKKNGDMYWEFAVISPVKDARGVVASFIAVKEDITQRKQSEEEREKLIGELQKALAEVKTLGGLIPICANCKKIRDDKGYWNILEAYLTKHSDAQFSHGICPDCAAKLYPNLTTTKHKDLGKK
jgi:PAS domain S-box-containing protein